jgi:hypothetical protein
LRKQHKKTLAELLETLKEANAELPKPENNAIIGEWVKSIKEFAAVIKNYIDSNVSDEIANKELAMHALDVYAEKVCEDVDETLMKRLKGQLHNIEIEINKFQVTQFEAIFIVSSAAKSDSLLPIFEAAAADPACIARWMPIPLQKFNPEQKIIGEDFDGPEHYPGIDCTEFRTYNFEQNHPDVIFTNDIYDGGNFISALPKFFWAENLRRFTDYLVYIPYFTMGKSLCDKTFVQYPSMLFCDLVVVENEKVRKLYTEAAMEIFENHYDYNRIIALGSPKYDRALQINKQFLAGELVIPDEWRRKIYNSDGSKKKVLFYNNSLQRLLSDVKEDDPKYVPGVECIKKIGQTVSAFKRYAEEKGNVVMLWRPHPLFVASIKSMRPWLLQLWVKTLEFFSNCDSVIIDENSDLHSAIAVSDCLYGDMSSLENLFDVLGKKSVYQEDITLLNIRWPNMLCFKDEIYIKNFFNSAVYKIDESGKILLTAVLPEVPLSNSRRHISAVISDEKIYYLPCSANSIISFEPNTNSFEQIDLDLRNIIFKAWDTPANFRNGLFYKKRLFLLPSFYDSICYYDFDNNELTECLDLTSILDEIGADKNLLTFLIFEYLNEHTVLLPFINFNYILEFDLDSFEYKLHKIGSGIGFVGITKYEDKFFLVGVSPMFLRWDYKNNEITEYSDFPKGFSVPAGKTSFGILETIRAGNILYCFNAYANMPVKFDLKTGKIERIDAFDPYLTQNIYGAYFQSACYNKSRNKIYLAEYSAKKILEYDLTTEEIKVIEINPDEIYDKNARQLIQMHIFYECLLPPDNKKPLPKTSADTIYNYIKEQVF